MVDFSISAVQAGLLVGATVFAIAMMSPVMGMISDRIGRKRLIVGCLLLLALPTGAMALSVNESMMMLLRFIQGLTVPGITVVTIAYVGEEYKGKALTSLMAYYVSGTVLGGFSGRFVLGHLHEWIGWRDTFWLMGAVTFFGALWVVWALPKSKKFIGSVDFKAGIAMLRSHAGNRLLLSACLLGFFVLFSLIGCFTFVNLYLADEPYQLSAGQLGNLFTVYLLGVVITPLTAWMIQRLGTTHTVMLAIAISMLGVVLTLASPLWAVIIGLAVMSSGIFITQSATISFIAMNISEGRSLASGIYYLCYYTGGGFGAWVCGLAYRYWQWNGVVIVLLVAQS